MDCCFLNEIKEICSEQFDELFFDKAISERIPVGGGLELTYRCNLHCLHCYSLCKNKYSREISYVEICKIINQLADAGTLYLFITGGEPLIRNDFPKIYKYIKKKGILVTIFTNGTLLSEDIAEIFSHYPPFRVEITMYGATQKTYETITGVKGSFNRCMNGIEILLKHNIHLSLKTVVMRYNKHEVEELKSFAYKLGVGFRYSSLIFPRLDSSLDTYDMRLSPEEIVKYDIEDSTRKQAWIKLLSENSPSLDSGFLYLCGAALTIFHIDAEGNLCACVRERKYRYNLLSGAFQDGWYNCLYNNIRMRKASTNYKCNKCKYLMVCDQCPPIFESENGNPEKHSEYICQIAHLRAQEFGL